MKQHGSHNQLPAPEELARRRFPSERIAFAAHDAADDQHRQADLGINPEQKVVHQQTPISADSEPGCPGACMCASMLRAWLQP